MNPVLVDHLRPVLARLLVRRFWLAAALGWLLLTLIFLGVLLGLRDAASSLPWNRGWLAVGCLAVIAGGLLIGLAASWPYRHDFSWAARQLEKKYGDLNACLITAVEQRPRSDGSYGYLQQEVIRRAVYHSFQHGWQQLVPHWQLAGAIGLGGLGLLAALGLSLAWLRWVPPQFQLADLVPFEQVALDEAGYNFLVEPGDTEIERGSSLLVFARFQGPLPPRAYMNFTREDGEPGRISMSRSLNDPVYAARLNDVTQPLDYSVDIESQVSPNFHVDVFTYPDLVRSDALLTFPSFTGLGEKRIEDVRRISAVVGTELSWSFRMNKPLASAQLVDEQGGVIDLQPSPDNPELWTTAITLESSRRMELRLTDDRGRVNRAPPRFFLNVVPHAAPKLIVKSPGRDIDASPIEEISLAAEVWSEFGGQAAGCTIWSLAGEPREVRLVEPWSGTQKVALQHLLALEELALAPDQLLTYYFWVDDLTREGKLRRTTSDLFFVEIRPFEEIFRQGQQPTEEEMRQQNDSAGDSPGAQQAEKLAELQKQIIAATWNTMRRETADAVSESYAEDVRLIAESQQTALDQLSAALPQLPDPQSSQIARTVIDSMSRAIDVLTSPVVAVRPVALQAALEAEQAAYQGLLRLRAREHDVVRQRQRGAAGQAGGSSRDAQMQELDLDQAENRYQQERLANGETPEARENRQVLNRLRELARRQADLNDRIKELQNALEQAANEEERAEIERRLKRLRDEQQQILRDTDELQERMQSPENREQMAESSQQLDEARENIRQSTSALESNQVSRAAAEGERARDQLDNLREEFQRRAAGQFSEQVQQLQAQAETLQETQERIGQQLAELEQPVAEPLTLQAIDPRTQLSQELREQAERLGTLQQAMKETVEQSEEIEPLLAEALYDTYRQTEQQQTQNRLRTAGNSLERGFDENAREDESRAREAIDALRAGIDQAAESVLGDQQAALRRASETLEELADELREEMTQNAPEIGTQDPQAQAQSQEQAADNPQGGQPPADRANNPDARPNDPAGESGGAGQSQSEAERDNRSGQPGATPQDSEDATRLAGGNRLAGGDPNQRMQRDDRVREPIRPMSGDFRDWSDRLRDVEEMLNDEQLRNEASRIRDQARELRRDMRERHSPAPQWDLVNMRVMQPLDQLRQRVRDELIRRGDRRSVLPLDRDPAPLPYQDAVRKYYQQLGAGK